MTEPKFTLMLLMPDFAIIRHHFVSQETAIKVGELFHKFGAWGMVLGEYDPEVVCPTVSSEPESSTGASSKK